VTVADDEPRSGDPSSGLAKVAFASGVAGSPENADKRAGLRELHELFNDHYPGDQARAAVRSDAAGRERCQPRASCPRKVGIFLHIGTLAIKLSPVRAANR
jgi:hypothetical protein